MVWERIRREPWGGTKKWNGKEKVWHKLEKWGITRFMEKLHGFDAGVTKVMVEKWNNGEVKIDGFTHEINEDLILEVTKIPHDGINFFKDKKMSDNAVSKFFKDDAERKKLIKVDT